MENAVNKVREIATTAPTTISAQQWQEEDSINLVDLWLELAKHRSIIFSITALALIAGLLIAFLQPQKYSYSTSIEIGSTSQANGSGESLRLIDQPETVLAKIKESYIPLAQQEYRKSHPADTSLYKIDVRAPKNSQLIVLEAKGTENNSPAYLEHLQSITDKLLNDHQRVMNIYRGRLNNQLALANIELDELTDPRMLEVPRQELESQLAKNQKEFIDLQDQAKLIKSRHLRLDDTDALLKQQINDLEAQIKSALSQRQQAIGNIKNESAAMSMLLIDNEIQQNRTRLAELQERLYINQQNLRQELEEKIAANLREQGVQNTIIDKTKSELARLAIGNQRAQQRQKQEVSKFKTQLNNLQPTRAITPPMQSLEPSGPGKSIIVILALILGLLLGVFAAFFASFLNKVKLQTAQI
jgi:LPS O-antigen subunit length determinant protein (WzzB/FepE family)